MTPLENNQDSYCLSIVLSQLQPFAYKLPHKISTIMERRKHRQETFTKEQFLVVCLFFCCASPKRLIEKRYFTQRLLSTNQE